MRAEATSASPLAFMRQSQRITSRSAPADFHPVPLQIGQTSAETFITDSPFNLHPRSALRKWPVRKLCVQPVQETDGLWTTRGKPVQHGDTEARRNSGDLVIALSAHLSAKGMGFAPLQ